jgi:hypothetical protein
MATHTGPAATEPDVGRAATIGALLGFLAVMVVVTISGLALGLEPGSALGLGTFVGMWTGMGFGFMFGATGTIARAERQAAAPIPVRHTSGH